MTTKLNGKGKVLEARHLLALAADSGENGDELDQRMTIAVSRNELKVFCTVLQGIGVSECWLRLCCSIPLEYQTKKGSLWKQTSLFSIAYDDDRFGEWVTIRVLRGDLFFPLYFLSLQKINQGQLSREACNECVEVFNKAGWQEAILYLERLPGLGLSEVVDRISMLDGQETSPAKVIANNAEN